MIAKWIEDNTKYEDEHMGNFRRIYPMEGTEKYDKFFHSSGSLYQETAAFKARTECARFVTTMPHPFKTLTMFMVGDLVRG